MQRVNRGNRTRRQRPRRGAVLALALLTTAGVAAVTPADTVEAATYETRSAPGPLGAVSIIGDSVMVGSLLYSIDLPDQLAAHGWGPIRARAGAGYSTGYFFNDGVNDSFKASRWIEQWRSEGWDPDVVIANFGANDASLCDYKPEPLGDCAYNAIMHLVDTIGPGKRIWWPKITRFPFNGKHYMDAWNAALDRVVAERDDFFTWDWPTVMYELGLYSPDHIHQSPSGYRERSRLMAYEITADLARGSQTGGAAPLPVAFGSPVEVVPIEPPLRVFNSRTDPPGRLGAEQTVTIDLTGHVPAGTTAVAAYIAAAGPSAPGHLRAHPCLDDPKKTSFVNYTTGNRGALTITPLSDELTFCVATRSPTDVLVDLQAAFVPDGLRFTPLDEPERLINTRDTGRSRHLELEVPDGAEMVSINITAAGAEANGRITAHACLPEIPQVANLNHRANEILASAAFVPVSDDGTICLDTLVDVDVLVDLTGVFAPDGDLAFQPAEPTRMVNTRDATGGWSPIHGRRQTVPAVVAPPEAQAVSGTITLVGPYRNSHLRMWACGPLPGTSNVNGPTALNIANFVTTGTDAGEACIFAANTGHTIFDTTGWWVP